MFGNEFTSNEHEDRKSVEKSIFTSEPLIVHFSGFTALNDQEVLSQQVKIINKTDRSQKFQILPPENKQFKINFLKSGSLAPGMCQIITITYEPNSFEYVTDFLRVKSESDILIIPIYAYPKLNDTEFPKEINFGDSPLLQIKKQVVTLTCSIPLNFEYRIEIIDPHPYFSVEPLLGVIPANGSVTIVVKFQSLMLGTFSTTLKLIVGQANFEPKKCRVIARGVSGIVKSHEIKEAENRLFEYVNEKNNDLLNTMKLSTKRLLINTENNNSLDFLNNSKWIKGNKNNLFRGVIHKEDLMSNKLLKFSVMDNRTLVAKPKDITPKLPENFKPHGIGSGGVFDAGSDWIRSQRNLFKSEPINRKINHNETTVGKYKIPSTLDSVTSVNSVLTQEIGKLKPKDLKVAIEKHRIEREKQRNDLLMLQADQGHSNEIGILKANDIITDDDLNFRKLKDVNFKQLRELIFLTNKNDYNAITKEKSINVSVTYLGSNIFSYDEINDIISNRNKINDLNKIESWLDGLNKVNTVKNDNTSISFKSIDETLKCIKPSFSINSNDIWTKRMNTLYKFIGLVSKCIVQLRVTKRLSKLKNVIKSNNINSKEDMRIYVENDNKRQISISNSKKNNDFSAISNITKSKNDSLVEALCNKKNDLSMQYQNNKLIISNNKISLNDDMFQRISLPKFNDNDNYDMISLSNNSNNISNDLSLIKFDDRQLFQIDTKNDFENFNFSTLNFSNQYMLLPTIDFVISTSESLNKAGADEEQPIYPSLLIENEFSFNSLDLSSWYSSDVINYEHSELNYYQCNKEYCLFLPQVENNNWVSNSIIHEGTQNLNLLVDTSVRNKWLIENGFLGINSYLMNNQESDSVKVTTFSRFYMPNFDRHNSGLSCFPYEISRNLFNKDPSIKPLQSKLHKQDELTDSESDDDTNYIQISPSFSLVRKILKTPSTIDTNVVSINNTNNNINTNKSRLEKEKSKKIVKDQIQQNPVSQPVIEKEIFLLEDNIAENTSNILLLRNEKFIVKANYDKSKRREIIDKITKNLLELSTSSQCKIIAVPVQMPFHEYEPLIREKISEIT